MSNKLIKKKQSNKESKLKKFIYYLIEPIESSVHYLPRIIWWLFLICVAYVLVTNIFIKTPEELKVMLFG